VQINETRLEIPHSGSFIRASMDGWLLRWMIETTFAQRKPTDNIAFFLARDLFHLISSKKT